MKTLNKNNFPVLFLITISVFWSYYYSGVNYLNGNGQYKQEWWLFLECFVSIPLVCFYCYWYDKKKAMLKSVVYVSLLILLGSFIIPTEEKYLWLLLEKLRYVLLFAFFIFEIITMVTVAIAIKASLNTDQDPDEAIKKPLVNILGDSLVSRLITIEARVWTYVLLKKKVKTENFLGNHHFYGYKKDGTQSNLLGFIIIILFELPIMHVLLHFIWSPVAANIITIVTAFSLMWFLAEYRALSMRPISLTDDQLIIRYGLLNPVVINIRDINIIDFNKEAINRNKKHKKYNNFGQPNIVISLKPTTQYNYESIYLGLDEPQLFIDMIERIRVSNQYQ